MILYVNTFLIKLKNLNIYVMIIMNVKKDIFMLDQEGDKKSII